MFKACLRWFWLTRLLFQGHPLTTETHRSFFTQPKAGLLSVSHQRHDTWQTRPFSRYQLYCWTQEHCLRYTVDETHTKIPHADSRKWTNRGLKTCPTLRLSQVQSRDRRQKLATFTEKMFNTTIILIIGWNL